MTSWASFSEADDAEQQPESEFEPEAEGPPAEVEDLALGRLRLWLRGVFGGTGRARD